jgi:hypothetical protein
MDLQVEAFRGELAGLWGMGLACLKGMGQQSGDPACLWIASLAGFRGMVPEIMQPCAGLGGASQWNGDCVCVDCWDGKPWWCGPVQKGSCRPVQA